MPKKVKTNVKKNFTYGIRLKKNVDPSELSEEFKQDLAARAKELRGFKSKRKLKLSETPVEADQDVKETNENVPGPVTNIPDQSFKDQIDSLWNAIYQLSGSDKLGKLVAVSALSEPAKDEAGQDVDMVVGYSVPSDGNLRTVKIDFDGVEGEGDERYERMQNLVKEMSSQTLDKQKPSDDEALFTGDAVTTAMNPVDPGMLFRSALGKQRAPDHIKLLGPSLKIGTQRVNLSSHIAELKKQDNLGFFPAVAAQLGLGLAGALANTVAGTINSVTNATTNTVA